MVSDFQVARWDFTVFRSLDRVCSSYLQSTKKPKKIRVSSSYPNQSEPLHNLFRVFALLNLRLHRRVKLLVLESSLLEFRVLVISCHAAAAPSSSPLPSTTTAYPPPLRIRIHIPPQLSYTTTAAIYHHISTTNPSSLHIRFVFEIHLDSDSCFLAGVGFGKKKSRVATLRLGPKFFENAFFEKISGYPIFRCFWVFWDRCHYRKFFWPVSSFWVRAVEKKNWSKKVRAHPISLG